MSTGQDHESFDIFTAVDGGWVLDSSFGAIPFGTGRFGGRCANFDNTGFGQKSLYKDIGGATSFWFHFALRRYKDPSGSIGIDGQDIFSIQRPSTSEVLFKLVTRTDAKLDCVHPDSLTTITTNTEWVVGNNTDASTGVWHSVEVLYDVSGNIKVYVDDVLDTDMNVTTSNHAPERVRFRWANLGNSGMNIDDYHYRQADSGAAALRRGPVRINGWRLGVDYGVSGWGRVGAASNAACVHDRSGVTGSAPDDDSTFVQVTIPAKDLYTLQKANICSGRILTVGATIVAKWASAAPSIRAIVRADPTNTTTVPMGSNYGLTSVYQVFRGYLDESPRTGDSWTDGGVENAVWGIESLGSGIARCTMFTVEKIVSLRNVSYDCGQIGSYAFGR